MRAADRDIHLLLKIETGVAALSDMPTHRLFQMLTKTAQQLVAQQYPDYERLIRARLHTDDKWHCGYLFGDLTHCRNWFNSEAQASNCWRNHDTVEFCQMPEAMRTQIFLNQGGAAPRLMLLGPAARARQASLNNNN